MLTKLLLNGGLSMPTVNNKGLVCHYLDVVPHGAGAKYIACWERMVIDIQLDNSSILVVQGKNVVKEGET